MLMKRIFMLLIALLTCGAATAFAAGKTELQIKVVKPGATVNIDQVIRDGRLLVNVVDANKNPLFGLKVKDFSITQSGRKAKITSVKPISESLDIPRHIVLVLDNSYSMQERNVVKPLLLGVDELLKTIRPIDQVYMVVFDNKPSTSTKDRPLHVNTFQSSQPAELKDFAKKSYGTGLTATTVLYEGMLAGLDIIAKIPATEPRFMVVFTDGEDLNSAFKREDVLKAAQDLGNFNAYAIDYMENPKTDKFLSKFADQNHGQIWKAKSEKNLVDIFQKVASKMQYFYVVNYEFLTTGKLTVIPASLTVNQVNITSPESRLDVSTLTLRPEVDSANGIAKWKVTVNNSKGNVAELTGEGAPAKELKVPLPASDLQGLAAGGDLIVKMELLDIKGQNLLLAAPPVKVKLLQTRADLAVAPASLTIEEIKTIEVSPMLGHIYFDKGSSDIPPRYVRLTALGETTAFDEKKFHDTQEKYYQLLNIIGKRLTVNSAASITLVGCNDNIGVEKGKKQLSGQRAESVKNYLQTVWNIAPERILIETRNLPAMPSSIRLEEGQAENRRVEIHSTEPLILAPIRSTYLATSIDASVLALRPKLVSPHGINSWKITVDNAGANLAKLSGNGTPVEETRIILGHGDLRALAAGGDITVKMEMQDNIGQKIVLPPVQVKVNFIQTSQRLAQKEGLRVREKYALILFDFNKENIGAANQEIISRIVDRIKTLPQATVEIIGHTDNIGKEDYNVKLSERRALTAHNLLSAAYSEAAGDRIRHSGVGPDSPLYDNLSPETRAFNRTVTITLEYLSAE
jgi:outer membrane protein OmpA-like peptidoglycan-associated protein